MTLNYVNLLCSNWGHSLLDAMTLISKINPLLCLYNWWITLHGLERGKPLFPLVPLSGPETIYRPDNRESLRPVALN